MKNKINNFNDVNLNKKPAWYLFALANVVVLLGCAITWGIILSKNPTNKYYLPTIICNFVSIILVVLFLWIEAKTTMPKIVHFQKKWLWWYLAAIIAFIFAIIFDFLFFYLSIDKNLIDTETLTKKNSWAFYVNLITVVLLTLISIGLQRYAKFRIDLDLYRRRHGQNPKKKEEEKNLKSFEKNDKKNSASSNLLAEIDKKQNTDNK